MFSDKLLGESSFLYLSGFVLFFFFWFSKITCFCFSILVFFFKPEKQYYSFILQS